MTEEHQQQGDSSHAGPGEVIATPFSRLERICFLVLGNRDLSLRTAKEATESSGTDDESTRTRTALALAVRNAESHGVTGRESSVLPPRGEGGLITPEDGEEVREIFMGLSPHSRGLLLSHFAFGFDPGVSAEVLNIDQQSIPVNVLSLLGKIRNATGTGNPPKGCGTPEAEALDRKALGAASAEEVDGIDRHLAGQCEACSARIEALEKERSDLAEILRPLLEPDRPETSLFEAAALMDREKDSIPFNPAKVLNMSKSSCMALMALIGLGGAFFLAAVTLTPQERRDILALLWTSPAPSTPPARESPTLVPPPKAPREAMTLPKSLEALEKGDESKRSRAEKALIKMGRSNLGEFLEVRRKNPKLRETLDGLLLQMGREKNRKMEAQAQASKRGLRGEAQYLARTEMERLPDRMNALLQEIETAGRELERLKSSGAPHREIRNAELRFNSLKLKHGDLEGVTLEHMTASIQLQLQAEVNARVKRCFSRRKIITPRASIGLLLDENPAFPWKGAIREQQSLQIPHLFSVPITPVKALQHLVLYVDFPLVVDPATPWGSPAETIALPADAPRVDAILMKVAMAARARWVEFDGAMYLTGSDELPIDLLGHLASHLDGGTSISRQMAAWGFETMTFKAFGFDPSLPPGTHENRDALEGMKEWFASGRASIVQDSETGLYGLPGEGHGE